ncbi:hypothetical protein HanPI659440_Chr05g0218911 [Helianthus annuus]|nr:hypothetical protein HanPI659440_Chr05g0218911 [Helianthus annuus]
MSLPFSILDVQVNRGKKASKKRHVGITWPSMDLFMYGPMKSATVFWHCSFPSLIIIYLDSLSLEYNSLKRC